MPTGDLVPGSDGQLAIVIGPWAREKLHYIQRYCDVFNTAMKGKWSKRTYIDLFSGPGICITEDTGKEFDGSPLIALKCKEPFTHYFFNDKDMRAINSLKGRVASLSSGNINYFNKDCNEVIEDLLRQLPPSALDFCFIDPTNWQIKFDSIRKLTQDRQTDLVITFQSGEMKRVVDNYPEELDDFFGDPTWQEEYKTESQKSGRKKGRVLLDIYEQRLRNVGYQAFDDHILVKTTGGLHLYYLLFASKHERGADLWHKISQKSYTGQLKLRIPKE